MSPIHKHVAPALSFNGGFVDTVGFLALQGLFTAHVTGNFVTLGVSIVHGTSGAIGKLLALPVFILVVGLTHLAAVALHRRQQVSLHPLMALHVLLLVLFAVLALLLGPFDNADSAPALLTGACGVAAMAIQNALSRQHLKAAPPTTLMTGNVTQIAIDLFSLLTNSPAEERAVVKARMSQVLANLTGFTAGCIGGAVAFVLLGLKGLLIPPVIAIWAGVLAYRGRP